MAKTKHAAILKKGVKAWNSWRAKNPTTKPDLSYLTCIAAQLPGCWLRNTDFTEANFNNSIFRKAVLTGSLFTNANFSYTNLSYSTIKQVSAQGIDLRGAYLDGADLSGSDLRNANLVGASLNKASLVDVVLTNANLTGASLRYTNLEYCELTNTDLSNADLVGSDVRHATVRFADMRHSNLLHTNLSHTDLTGSNLFKAILGSTILGDTNLTDTGGLEACEHSYGSILDQRTLVNSRQLPLTFLRGCGLPDKLIQHIPELLNEATSLDSCFISYSSKDRMFAERLYSDVQNNGVRCWFAPEDLKIGDQIREDIDKSIHKHDKLLLVLSKNSIQSQWVEQEVETALARERDQHRRLLFPIRLDNTVMRVQSGWPAFIRNTRFIGDFRQWKSPDKYKVAFDRLLQDLKLVKKGPQL